MCLMLDLQSFLLQVLPPNTTVPSASDPDVPEDPNSPSTPIEPKTSPGKSVIEYVTF